MADDIDALLAERAAATSFFDIADGQEEDNGLDQLNDDTFGEAPLPEAAWQPAVPKAWGTPAPAPAPVLPVLPKAKNTYFSDRDRSFVLRCLLTPLYEAENSLQNSYDRMLQRVRSDVATVSVTNEYIFEKKDGSVSMQQRKEEDDVRFANCLGRPHTFSLVHPTVMLEIMSTNARDVTMTCMPEHARIENAYSLLIEGGESEKIGELLYLFPASGAGAKQSSKEEIFAGWCRLMAVSKGRKCIYAAVSSEQNPVMKRRMCRQLRDLTANLWQATSLMSSWVNMPEIRAWHALILSDLDPAVVEAEEAPAAFQACQQAASAHPASSTFVLAPSAMLTHWWVPFLSPTSLTPADGIAIAQWTQPSLWLPVLEATSSPLLLPLDERWIQLAQWIRLTPEKGRLAMLQAIQKPLTEQVSVVSGVSAFIDVIQNSPAPPG
jgi:hypothetical protein